MLTFRFLRRRSSYERITRHLDINIRSRVYSAMCWLSALTGLHVAAMMTFEGLGPGNAVWLTLTTLTTVGYGDLSAATPMGRLATVALLYVFGITLLAQLGSDYIDYRLQRKSDMIRGRKDWRMKDHVLIIHSPAHNPAQYFERLVKQLRQTAEYAHAPVQILTDDFPDGLPDNLRRIGVVHHGGDSSDRAVLEAVTPAQARAVIVLARDEYRRVSDSVTLDVLLQLKELFGAALPYTVAECVQEDNRRRAQTAGANTTLRPIRAYPEIMVRSLVAPGAEQVLENLFTHHDDHAVRYGVALTDAVWADVVCRLMTAGLGTLMAYVDTEGHVVCHPAHDHRFDAEALIVMVRADAVPTTRAVRRCVAPAPRSSRAAARV